MNELESYALFTQQLNVFIGNHVLGLLEVPETLEGEEPIVHQGRKAVTNVFTAYEGYNDKEEDIYCIGIVVAPKHFLNAHVLVQEAKTKSGLLVWPDLRWYGRDAGILRFTMYVKRGVENKK